MTNRGNDRHKWSITRERIFATCGLLLIAASFINSDVRGGTFHFEFLIGGLALCGISITQWGDRR